MWEARAEYADGTTVEKLFEYNDRISDNEQQYNIECWLLEYRPNCIWYSVSYIAG